MFSFYSECARYYQDRFDSRRLADRAHELIVHDSLTENDRSLIQSVDFFFLATVDAAGQPQCSYKGGPSGFVRVLDASTVAFPSYDGNGMFLSLGNIRQTRRIGMLFIDFQSPFRLRLNGTAAIADDDPLLADYHQAQAVVRVEVAQVFVNCSRYVHQFQRVATSPYVPSCEQPAPIPDWKRRPVLRDVLPARDQQRLAQEEGNPG